MLLLLARLQWYCLSCGRLSFLLLPLLVCQKWSCLSCRWLSSVLDIAGDFLLSSVLDIAWSSLFVCSFYCQNFTAAAVSCLFWGSQKARLRPFPIWWGHLLCSAAVWPKTAPGVSRFINALAIIWCSKSWHMLGLALVQCSIAPCLLDFSSLHSACSAIVCSLELCLASKFALFTNTTSLALLTRLSLYSDACMSTRFGSSLSIIPCSC